MLGISMEQGARSVFHVFTVLVIFAGRPARKALHKFNIHNQEMQARTNNRVAWTNNCANCRELAFGHAPISLAQIKR